MKRRLRLLVLLAVPLCCLAALAGVDLANAVSGPPAVTLSTASGPAGTSFTVTLPAPCTVPSGDSPDPDALSGVDEQWCRVAVFKLLLGDCRSSHH